MKFAIPRSFYAGLAVYAGVFALAAAPVFPTPLTTDMLTKLVTLAIIASLAILILLVSGLDRRLGDPGAHFTQAVFGIAICAGMYAYLSGAPRPSVLDLSLLWIIVGISDLGTRRVIALLGTYFSFYLFATYPLLTDVAAVGHGDAIYTLAVSLVLGGFLFWRAHEYERLHGISQTQAIQLEAAGERIHTLTVEDSDTTALKFGHFIGQLKAEKARVDSEGGTFSIGLVEIDGYDEMVTKVGDMAVKQLLREFSNRATNMIRKVDVVGAWPTDFRPLGRVEGGRFSLLLPATNYEGALKCAERLHTSPEFRSIRTNAGILGITLSIGFTEYSKRESVEEVMQLATRALTRAKAHNGNDFQGLRRAVAA